MVVVSQKVDEGETQLRIEKVLENGKYEVSRIGTEDADILEIGADDLEQK